jgi:hypothetical protein
MEQPDSTPPDETVLSAQIMERLLRFDEISEDELSELEMDPSAQDHLHRLQLAEAWLTEPFSLDTDIDEGSCPSAEELFDYGQSMGSMQLNNRHKVELTEHIEGCDECSALVSTLAERPPSPLIVVDSPSLQAKQEPMPSTGSARPRLARRPSSLEPSGVRQVPFLVAASLLAVLIVSGWPKSVLGKSTSSFPSPSIMRGQGAMPLISPRNLVLARTQGSSPQSPLSGLHFEMRPYLGAVGYEFEIFEGSGPALQDNNQRESLYRKVQSTPDLFLATPLPIGRYSWTAVAVLESKDRVELGELDFRVIKDEYLEDELGRLGPSVEAVRRLDWGHYHADARMLTRALRDQGLCDPQAAAVYLQEPTP